MNETKINELLKEYVKLNLAWDIKHNIVYERVRTETKKEQIIYYMDILKPYFLKQLNQLEEGIINNKLVFIHYGNTDNLKLYILKDNELINFNIFFYKLISKSYNYNKNYFVKSGGGYSLACELWYNIAYLLDLKTGDLKQNYKEIY